MASPAHTSPPATAPARQPSSPTATTASTPSSPGPPGTPASPRASAESARPRVLLDFNGDVMLRSSPGTCQSGDATLERSEDGRTWNAAELPAHAVLAVTASSTEVSLIGTDTACVPEKWVSDDRGGTWRQVDAGGDWYLAPDEPRQVHVPGRKVQSPCRRTIDLAPTSRSDAGLLCASGSVYVTSNGGESWSRGDGVEGAVELTFVNPSTGWALVPGGSCGTGTRVVATVNGAASWEKRGCVDVGRPEPMGLAFRTLQTGLLVAGDATYGTSDGGRNWKRLSS